MFLPLYVKRTNCPNHSFAYLYFIFVAKGQSCDMEPEIVEVTHHIWSSIQHKLI